MDKLEPRYIVTGVFERAKTYWILGVIAKMLIGIVGFLVAAFPAGSFSFAICVLVLETVYAASFFRADELKASAEPVLMRLDLEESLGWPISKAFIDDLRADYGTFAAAGQRIRGGDAYFAQNDLPPTWERLRDNISESALYTRSIAAKARNVVLVIFTLLLVAVIGAVISGVYKSVFQGQAKVQSFLVDALLFLVTVDLLPLALRYNRLRNEASKARSELSSLLSDSNEAAVMPIAIQYQLARAVAPLLPTFAFLNWRFPLAAIWNNQPK